MIDLEGTSLRLAPLFNWEQRKLGELANIVRGSSPRPIQNPKWFDKNSNIGWLRIADVTQQNGRINHLEQHISEAGQQKTRVLLQPHLLLSIAATVGKPVINYIQTGVHDGFLIFLTPIFDKEYMFQWLEMFRPLWQKYGQPGSQVNLNSELVRNQLILIPNINEQENISAFFLKLDYTIALQLSKVQKLKELKQGYLQVMFPVSGEYVPYLRFANFFSSWEQRRLSEVTDIYDGTHQTPKYKTSGIMFLSVENIKTLISHKYISEEAFTSNFKIRPRKNDIMMTRIGDVGTPNIIKTDIPIAYYVSLALFKSKKLRPYFLKSSIESNFVQREIWKRTLHIAFPKKINKNEISKVPINYPIANEQKQIGKFLKILDHAIALQQTKLEKLQQIKKAYLQKMFI